MTAWQQWKEGIVLFNNGLNTFYLRLYGVKHMVKYHSDSEREETCCRHMGYSFRLVARVLLYASSHRQDNTYHSLCYTSLGALAWTRNSSMGPSWRIDPTTHRTMSKRSYHGATSRSWQQWCMQAVEHCTTHCGIFYHICCSARIPPRGALVGMRNSSDNPSHGK